jgi:hypothetical protein
VHTAFGGEQGDRGVPVLEEGASSHVVEVRREDVSGIEPAAVQAIKGWQYGR